MNIRTAIEDTLAGLREQCARKYPMPPLRIGDKTVPLSIVQGGMGVGISLSNLAAAVAREGGIGVIAANAIGMTEAPVPEDAPGQAAHVGNHGSGSASCESATAASRSACQSGASSALNPSWTPGPMMSQKPGPHLSVTGSQTVEAVRYDEAARRVYINAEQYFEGVAPNVWAFQVGGYQVLHKWLKDRKGRTLSFADLHHYQKIVVALAETIRLMAEIDTRIEAHGGWPLDRGPDAPS